MIPDPKPAAHRPVERRVVFTRGQGCAQLASFLTAHPVRVVGDLRRACLEVGADLVVARKLSSFDLTNVAVPHQFDPSVPSRVVALVGSGPHSSLAADLAGSLSEALGVPTELVTAYVAEEERTQAAAVLEAIAAEVELEGRLVRVESVADLTRHTGENALVVLGAAGGSLLQRMFFGPGARLKAGAPAGAIVVRAAPDRVFRHLGDPVYVAAQMTVSDAARLVDLPLVPVVEDGRLVGLLDRSDLARVTPTSTVSELMGQPVSASQEDRISDLDGLFALFEPGPVPVTDSEGRLMGSVQP